SKDFLLSIKKQTAGLVIDFNGDTDEVVNKEGAFSSFKSLFSETLSVGIDKSFDNRHTINVDLGYRNAPPDSSGFTFIYIKANISVDIDGRSIFSTETKEFKGGGLNWTQANEKAFEKLIKAIKADNDFTAQAKKVLAN
ncbi:MAG: hypothetical protein PQJ46_00310, partial [Spirochaetales bacterium]|nr:hypothetical protein [Spirochaetales bacterium]